MSIQFRCEGCGKTVKAPDSAAGRQGRCPACKHVMYVPLPPEQREEIPIAPDDDEHGHARQLEEDQALLDRLVEEETASAAGGTQAASSPPGDMLETLAVGFVLSLAQGQMERAERFAAQLARSGQQAQETVDRMMLEQIPHDNLKDLPAAVVNGYLKQLREKL